MVLRRILMAMAALALLAPTAGAQQSAKPVLVLLCNDASDACKTWHKQWEPMFVATPAYRMIDIRAIETKTSKDMVKPVNWPADLRWLLDTFLMSQQGQWEEYETPRFFLLQNGSVTASTAGNNGWREFMWPTILDVTNTKP
jgi:hypothetical protein